MGKRRLAQLSTSSDEEEGRVRGKHGEEDREEEDEKEEEEEEEREERGAEEEEAERQHSKTPKKKMREEQESSETHEEEAKPLGEVIRKSGRGKTEKKHYSAFELDGNRIELEDPVLITPEEKNQKPYVAIIKDITQSRDGSMAISGQWFYRPEEAEKKGGGSWQARDTRELFYSFHQDEVPAESVMHKCVVHFVPLNKKLPLRSEHPGFIVQKVYDTVERKLWKLTDKDYEDDKQHQIDLLVQKTREALGELPDLEIEEAPVEQEEQQKKRQLRKRHLTSINTTREDGSEPFNKAETPGTAHGISEFYSILMDFTALTGDTHRDKALEKLLQGIQYVFDSNGVAPSQEAVQEDSAGKKEPVEAMDIDNQEKGREALDESQKKNQKGDASMRWPDTAVNAVTALEKASYEALGMDPMKYNQKVRQLSFNLKNNPILAKRLLNKDLEASVILNMTPVELKDGLTAEEKNPQEPQDVKHMQMTDARCSRCTEKRVGLLEIIHGGYGDRYQLECQGCGHSWYSSRDSISALTIEQPNQPASVGTAPLATTKFEDVERKLMSPRGGSEK
ncbi:histone acetyltransferase KAT6B [Amborella trichopoda]|uniref:BAH domain-containing protein n=1 Tax=Amborella trichopoda TaxID=13333 RepID=W1NIR8_AMBTC|nr:histone acetyltransferase KAT6B [Amborella trichopoda]ERM95070.1 hypothetical protein AMTR_s00009p00250870 [Amborella trichopoda]|eukprot:XP_020526396.1 histone acetyltransferase KAT6B [Amborella trichopoda]